MPRKSYRAAINEAMAIEMRRDPSVIVMGEDVSGGTGAPGEDDAWGGPLGVTKGLHTEFGSSRVLDTPISEGGFLGAAAGAAITGMRPIVELMFVDFLGVGFDAIYNQAGKFRYMFGGKAETPLVVRNDVRRRSEGCVPAQPDALFALHPCARREGGRSLQPL